MAGAAARLAPTSQPAITGTSGDMMRAARLDRHLTMRQVVMAARCLAVQLDNEEYAVSLGHLSEIETRDILPNIYRLYSLAAIYELDLLEVLAWFRLPQTICSGRLGLSADARESRIVFTFPNRG